MIKLRCRIGGCKFVRSKYRPKFTMNLGHLAHTLRKKLYERHCIIFYLELSGPEQISRGPMMTYDRFCRMRGVVSLSKETTMTTPQTEAEWLDILRRLNPDGLAPEIISDPQLVTPCSGPNDTSDGASFTGADTPGSREQTCSSAGPPGLLMLVADEFAADVAAIWTADTLADYLLATERQRHVWHCWLASPFGGLMRKARVDPARMRCHLATRNAKDLLRDVYGDCPPGLVTALGKCGARARTRDFYPALVRALARQDLGAKHIRHAGPLSDLAVISIAALPTALQSKPLFAKLCTAAFDEEYFPQACWTLRRLADLGLPDAIDRVVRSGEPTVAMSEAVASLPFPEPPWPGADRLRPLTSVEALRVMGDRLGNCLRARATEYAIKVVTGGSYYYELLGDEPGVVTVESVRPLGWVVEDGHGSGNNPISPSTWAQIGPALATWAELAPLWVNPRGVVQGSGFFKARLF